MGKAEAEVTGGPGARGKKKNGGSTSKFKNLYFPSFKIAKNLLERDQTTKNKMQ
jgi:hypothetical protein